MHMKYSSFQFLRANIERDITPVELAKVGIKPKSPAERLTLTLRFLATGESFRSLSFSVSYIEVGNFLHSAKSLQGDYRKSGLHIPKST